MRYVTLVALGISLAIVSLACTGAVGYPSAFAAGTFVGDCGGNARTYTFNPVTGIYYGSTPVYSGGGFTNLNGYWVSFLAVRYGTKTVEIDEQMPNGVYYPVVLTAQADGSILIAENGCSGYLYP
jgi:hypothetical protein